MILLQNIQDKIRYILDVITPKSLDVPFLLFEG